MSFFQTLLGSSGGDKAAFAEVEAEWLEQQSRASAFRCKVRDAAEAAGIDPELFDHVAPEYVLVAILLGVKS